MADQAERVILEAEDQVTPIVDKANAGLDSFEKKAESSHGKVMAAQYSSYGRTQQSANMQLPGLMVA
jgi:hypothetical protein